MISGFSLVKFVLKMKPPHFPGLNCILQYFPPLPMQKLCVFRRALRKLAHQVSLVSPGMLFHTVELIPAASACWAVLSVLSSFILSRTRNPIVETRGPIYGIRVAARRRMLTANSVPAPMSDVCVSWRLIWTARDISPA